MPSVPIYQRTNEKVRPIQTQDFGNRAATPDAFGASIGRGLQEASNGLSAASAAIAAVQVQIGRHKLGDIGPGDSQNLRTALDHLHLPHQARQNHR